MEKHVGIIPRKPMLLSHRQDHARRQLSFDCYNKVSTLGTVLSKVTPMTKTAFDWVQL